MPDVEQKNPGSETETDDATPAAKPSLFQRWKTHMKRWWWVHLIVVIVVVLVIVLPL